MLSLTAGLLVASWMLPVTRSSLLCKAAQPISKLFSLIESSFLCWTKPHFWALKIPSICWASPLAKRWQIISDCPFYCWGNWCSESLSVLPGPPSGQKKDLDSEFHSPYNACICHCNFIDWLSLPPREMQRHLQMLSLLVFEDPYSFLRLKTPWSFWSSSSSLKNEEIIPVPHFWQEYWWGWNRLTNRKELRESEEHTHIGKEEPQ